MSMELFGVLFKWRAPCMIYYYIIVIIIIIIIIIIVLLFILYCLFKVHIRFHPFMVPTPPLG